MNTKRIDDAVQEVHRLIVDRLCDLVATPPTGRPLTDITMAMEGMSIYRPKPAPAPQAKTLTFRRSPTDA